MKNIYLGINVSHGASASLIINGEIILAFQEERFNKIKNFVGYPKKSIDKCIDYNTEDTEKEIMDFTNGKGVDLIIDPLGAKNWKLSYRVLAKMGKLIIYGDQELVKGDKLKPLVALKEMYSMPKYRPMDLMANNKTVMGYHLGRFKGHEWKVQRSIENLVKLINNNDIHPIIDNIFSYEDAPKAHRHIQNRKNFGKVLLDFTSV